MAFVQRLLNFTFTRSSGNFAGETGNQLNLSGLRSKASISLAGTISMEADLEIYGMTLSHMNDLSTLGWSFRDAVNKRDQVTVQAGDVESGLATVFQGTVQFAYIQGASQPDVCLVVHAQSLGADALANPSSITISGAADVAQLVQQLAGKMSLTVENTGVSGKLDNPHLWGSPVQQLTQLAQSAGFDWCQDGNKLAVWANNKSRPGAVPLIAPPPDGEMIGYPTYTATGIMVRTVFNRNVIFGGDIQVKSSLTAANGKFHVYQLGHELESLVPSGRWESTIEAQQLGTAVVTK